MWYPSKLQWLVIWIATVVLMILWLVQNDPQPEAFVMPLALVGVLFLWQVSADFRSRKS